MKIKTTNNSICLIVISILILFSLGFPIYYSSPKLTHKQFVGWNSFIGMHNILEISNSDERDHAVRVNYHQIDGAVTETLDFTLRSGQQRDLILNDFRSFVKDSYGIVTIESDSASIGGRLSYYRSSAGKGDFDFVFSAPLRVPSYKQSSVSYNTYDPNAGSVEVSNWLTLINLSNTDQAFVIEKRDQDGILVTPPVTINLGPLARFDYEAGHVNPGANRIGLIRTLPLADNAPYLSNLTRYGWSKEIQEFTFAFQIQGVQDESSQKEKLYSSIKKSINGDAVSNWLEVINTSDQYSRITVNLYDSSGTQLVSEVQDYPPFAQKHFQASHILGRQAEGMAEIYSENGMVNAQSMFYIHDNLTNRVLDIYGSQVLEKPSETQTQILSWNRFIKMENYLTLINPSKNNVESKLIVKASYGSKTELNISIPAHGSQTLNLHEDNMGTITDNYGTVGFKDTPLIGEVLRVRRVSDVNANSAKSSENRSAPGRRIDFVNNTKSSTYNEPKGDSDPDGNPTPTNTPTPVTTPESDATPSATETPRSTVAEKVMPSAGATLNPHESPDPTQTYPPCPSSLSHCATLENGENVCCNANSDCDLVNKECRTSGSRCGEYSRECGDTCCNAGQLCFAEISMCKSRCDEGKTECALGNGTLGCCPAGTQCQVDGNGGIECVTPPEESRCKPPQYACMILNGDPHAPSNQGTSCCNPGTTCVLFEFENVSRSACCPPGHGPNTTTGSSCEPLGEECGSPENKCAAGQICCKPKNEAPFCITDALDACEIAISSPNPTDTPT